MKSKKQKTPVKNRRLDGYAYTSIGSGRVQLNECGLKGCIKYASIKLPQY